MHTTSSSSVEPVGRVPARIDTVARAARWTCIAAALAACGGAHAQSAPTMQPAVGTWTLGVEALAMWQKGSPTPTPIITSGVVGQMGTSVLLGGGTLDTNPGGGFRLAAGYGMNADWALDGAFFFVDRRSTSRSVSSSGLPDSTDLLLPYFDVNANREAVTEISFAGDYSGAATTQLTNRLMGAEGNVSWPLASMRGVSMFAGVRWLQLEETYSIATSSPSIPPNAIDIWTTSDVFDTSNNFYGAQVGIRGRYDDDRWYATGSGKVALGGMVEKVGIGGQLNTNDFTGLTAVRTYAGGYFALPSNIGSKSRTEFAVVPELALTVGYHLTPAMSLFAGYNVLYASNVVRPGNQIDRNLNTTQSVAFTGEPVVDPTGPAKPSSSFNSSTYWAQNLSVGLEFRF